MAALADNVGGVGEMSQLDGVDDNNEINKFRPSNPPPPPAKQILQRIQWNWNKNNEKIDNKGKKWDGAIDDYNHHDQL